MRYSLLGLLGSGFITIAAGCSDDGSVPIDDPAAGRASKAGTGGTGGSGKAGTAGKAGAGKGGSASKGGSAGKGGRVGVGGTGATHTGGAGADAGASGAEPGAGAGGLAGSGNAGGEAGTAGAEAAGAGGEAGSGNPCPGGVECAAECIDPSVRTLDQISLQSGGTIVLSKAQRPGQSFTVGTAGLLKGIELAVSACNGADLTGQIQLELFDEQATSLGHVTLDPSPLRTDCGITDLVEETLGTGYFDVTPLCLSVEPSTKLTFVLSLVGGTPATCDMGTYQCSNSGNFCYSDDGCSGSYNVAFTNCGGYGCDTAGYPGGEAVTQNVNTGELSPLPGFELEFKTFIQ